MQHNSLSYSTLLQRLTIDSKDDGNKFTICNRVNEIKGLLQSSNYRLIHEGPLSLIYARLTDRPNGTRSYPLISIVSIKIALWKRPVIVGKGLSTTVRRMP